MAEATELKVQLIAYTPQPERVVALAARLCYSALSGDALQKDLQDQKVEKLLDQVLSRGHHSVLEHATFTFLLEGVSRVTTHQLVRHRIGCSFSQRSQRYVREEGPRFIVPWGLEGDLQGREEFLQACEAGYREYERLLQKGYREEEARYVLPQAMESRLLMTMSARALHHFFHLRCCNRAQEEIRTLARTMLKLVRDVAPGLFQKAGPFCVQGECPEGPHSCGKKGG